MNIIFTGIIQEKGKFLRKFKGNNKYQLEIEANEVLKGLKKGDSIAVNGVCLTVVDFSENYFRADVMPVTLKNTNLNLLKNGDLLNLEASLRPSSSIGGHFVSGHVDSTAVVKNIKTENNAKIIKFELEEKSLKYIIPKGSIAVNGVSLTVMELGNTYFKVSLIPASWSQTNLSLLNKSDQVNIETDMLGKYVYKMLKDLQFKNQKNDISKSFLAENGFI